MDLARTLFGFDATSHSHYVPPIHKIPSDPNDPDFLKSFPVDDLEGIKSFFDEFGFVVVDGVLTPQECEETIDDIWTYIESRGFITSKEFREAGKRVDRNDPNTWERDRWPSMAEEGILGGPSVFTARALLNRQNPHIYNVCSALLGKKELLVNHDRYGLFRPTVGVTFPDGKVQDKPNWKTFENVHLDMNPWSWLEEKTDSKRQRVLSSLTYDRLGEFIGENNEIGVKESNEIHIQCLINLKDNREQDGGFQIVPGFRKHLEEWASKTGHLKSMFGLKNNFIVLPDTEPITKQAKRVTLRAGSIVIWDQRTPHGSAPNHTNNIRYAQFFKIFSPEPFPKEVLEKRTAKLKSLVEEAGCTDRLTELGRKLFGFESW